MKVIFTFFFIFSFLFSNAQFTPANSGVSSHILTVKYLNDSTLLAGGVGVILKSTNNGLSWTPVLTGANLDLYGSYFIDNNTGFMAGSGGVLLRTTNAGATWEQPFPFPSDETSGIFILKMRFMGM